MIKEQKEFINNAKEHLKTLDIEELLILKAHYIFIVDNHLSTFRDCIWLTLINKSLSKHGYYYTDNGKKTKQKDTTRV